MKHITTIDAKITRPSALKMFRDWCAPLHCCCLGPLLAGGGLQIQGHIHAHAMLVFCLDVIHTPQASASLG